jgi:adenylosuccinate synthase
MKLDVLDTFSEIQICTHYEVNGKVASEFPANQTEWDQVTPVYTSVPGWQKPCSDVRTYDALPDEAKQYVEKLEHLLDLPVEIVSVGPDDEETIIR